MCVLFVLLEFSSSVFSVFVFGFSREKVYDSAYESLRILYEFSSCTQKG